MPKSRPSTMVCFAVFFVISQALLAQNTSLDSRNAYLQFTNQLAKAKFRPAVDLNEITFQWETNRNQLWFHYPGASGLLDTRAMQVIEVRDITVPNANRARSREGGKSPPVKLMRNLGDMESKAKEISSSFGWKITDVLAPAWTFDVPSHFSSHLVNWAFRWHRKVNDFRLFQERVQIFISDKGLELESFKCTLTTNAYDFPVGPLLTTNALHAAIIKHENLNHPGWLERGTPDRKLPVNLILREMVPPSAPAKELYVVEADYSRRWNYPTPTKGPGGKAKEFRLAYHIYYFILDGTPGRGEKELHREFGCFDAITGAALLHDW